MRTMRELLHEQTHIRTHTYAIVLASCLFVAEWSSELVIIA